MLSGWLYGVSVSSGSSTVVSTSNLTPASFTLSDADATMVTVPEIVDPAAGDVMEIVGGVVSPDGEEPAAVTITMYMFPLAGASTLLPRVTRPFGNERLKRRRYCFP